jgi:hypothetical protein
MSDIVLGGVSIELTSDVGRQFVVDCTRAAEGLVTDKELVEKYEISPADFGNIAKDTALIRAIQAERNRRVHNGTAARESAARHFIKAPTILDKIMSDEQANARHRIEAIREMRQVAVPENQNNPSQSERFIIRIDLTAGGDSEDVLTFNKSIAVSPDDAPPDEQPKVVHALEPPEKRKRGRPRKLTVVPNNGADNTTKAITYDNKLTAEDVKFMQAFSNDE